MITDTQILDWLEKHPNGISWLRASDYGPSYWRRVFGPKDLTNQFKTFRAAVVAQIQTEKAKNHSRKKK